MNARTLLLCLSFSGLGLSACAAMAPPPTTTPSSIPTPTLTRTQAPTVTPTFTPSLTPTPTATPLPAVISPSNAKDLAQLGQLGQGTPSQIALSPDGKTIAVATFAGVYLYDAETLESIAQFDPGVPAFAIAFSPEGERLAVGGSGGGVSAGPTGSLQLLDIGTGQILQSLEGHETGVISVAFSPDGQTIASAGSDDKVLRLWDVSTGELVHALEGHTDDVFSVLFSPDGKTLASASDDQTLRLWDVSSGKPLQSLQADPLRMVFASDGQTVAAVGLDGRVRVWQVDTGELLRELEVHPEFVLSADFSPDGRILAIANVEGNVEIWDLETGRMVQTVPTVVQTANRTGTVYALAFGREGDTLFAINNEDHVLRKWQVSSGQPLGSIEGFSSTVTSLAFAPNGNQLAAGTFNGPVRVWDTATGELIHLLRGHTDTVSEISFSPQGATLTTIGLDGMLRQWDIASGMKIFEQSGVSLAGTVSMTGLLAQRAGPDQIEVISPGTQTTLWRFGASEVVTLAFSPDGRRLAAGSLNGTVAAWDLTSGELLMSIEGHEGAVLGMSFSPESPLLASVGEDSAVRVYEVSTGQQLNELATHGLTSVAFSPDGRFLATGGFDGAVRLWGVRP